MNQRLLHLQEALPTCQLDQLLVTDYYNLYYFTGLTIQPGERLLALLVNQTGVPVLVVNELFPVASCADYSVVHYNDTEDAVAVLAAYLQGKIIGVDQNWRAGFLLRVMHLYQAEYREGTGVMAELRAIKDMRERSCMLQASVDNDEVMRRIVPYLKEGVTEKQVAAQLQKEFTAVTKETVSFEAIVAFGVNGADPHHMPDDSVLQAGDTVVIDMGGKHKGYCSDMTRTFLYHGTEMEAIYQLVLQANLAAIKAVRPGVSFAEVDRAARSVIEAGGYGEYFIHRTGHGIGLEVHEPYDVSATNERLIEEGMCFSIEPGIYLPERGGVRIEDLVMADKDGVIVLNQFSKTAYLL